MKRLLILLSATLYGLTSCKDDVGELIVPPAPEPLPGVEVEGIPMAVKLNGYNTNGSIQSITIEDGVYVVKTTDAVDPWFILEAVDGNDMDWSANRVLHMEIRGATDERPIVMFFGADESKLQYPLNCSDEEYSIPPCPQEWVTLSMELSKGGGVPIAGEPWTSVRFRPGLYADGDTFYIRNIAMQPSEETIPDPQGPLDLSASDEDVNAVKIDRAAEGWQVNVSAARVPYFFLTATEPVDFSLNYVLAFQVSNSTATLPLKITLGEDPDGPASDGEYYIPQTGTEWTDVVCDLSGLTPDGDFSKIRLGPGSDTDASFTIRNIVIRPPLESDPVLTDPIPFSIRTGEGATQNVVVTDGENPGEWVLQADPEGEVWFYLDAVRAIPHSTHSYLSFEVRRLDTPIGLWAMWCGSFASWPDYGREFPIAASPGDRWTTVTYDLSDLTTPPAPWTWIRVAFPPGQSRPVTGFEVRNFEIGPTPPPSLSEVPLRLATSDELIAMGLHGNTLDGGGDPESIGDGAWKIKWGDTVGPNFFIVADETVTLRGKILTMEIRNAQIPTGTIAIHWNNLNYSPGDCCEAYGLPQAGSQWETVSFDLSVLSDPPATWRYFKIANTEAQKEASGRAPEFEVRNIRIVE